jgi:hypothetical protein
MPCSKFSMSLSQFLLRSSNVVAFLADEKLQVIKLYISNND